MPTTTTISSSPAPANGPDNANGAVTLRYGLPLQICPAPAAEAIIRELYADGLLPGAKLYPFQNDEPPVISGPAILVLRPEDLRGPKRGHLLALANAARPARPVLYGGTNNRDILLDAINTWRVLRIVPEGPRHSLLVDGIRKAQDALELECSLERAAAELRDDTRSLEDALRVLRDTEERSRQAERLATLGRFTSSLIPVIGTHLDALQDFNGLLANAERSRDPRLDELLSYAFTGIRSLNAMLDEIRGYAESRPENYKLELQDADEIVRFAVSFCRYDPLAVRRRVFSELGAKAKIRADTFRLYQSFINLLRNAFQATPAGGEIVVRTSSDEKDVLIEIENTGDPIPPEVQKHLFEPFFSTKGDEGMGLGLSMCKSAIEKHGGTIACFSGPGQRTRFVIRLPYAGPSDATL
jgi:signal transduction histidine kinase